MTFRGGLGYRADDREAEAGGSGFAVAAEEAFEDLVVELGRDAWPVVLDGQDDLAVDSFDRRLDRVPGSAWRSAFSSRFSAEPVELVAGAGDRRAGRRGDGDVVAVETGSSSPAASVITPATLTGSWR